MWTRNRLIALLLVLLVASSLLWAFPGRKQKELEIQEEQLTEVKEASSVKEAPIEKEELKTGSEEQKKSETASKAEVTEVKAVKAVEELHELLVEQAEDQMEAEADIERLEKSNEELYQTNAEQADEIAYQRGLLDKSKSPKFFSNIKGIIGFEDKKPTWSLGADFGVRFSKGLIVSAGAAYRLGTFTSPVILEADIDNLSLSLGIGWEW